MHAAGAIERSLSSECFLGELTDEDKANASISKETDESRLLASERQRLPPLSQIRYLEDMEVRRECRMFRKRCLGFHSVVPRSKGDATKDDRFLGFGLG